MHLTAREIAELFDIGAPTSPIAPLAGGASSQAVFQFATDRGEWVVKTQHGLPDWKRVAMEQSYILERAAADSKVIGMAEPVAVPDGNKSVGYWLWLPELDQAIRVQEKLPGASLSAPVSAGTAAWAGAAVAHIASLNIPADAAADEGNPVHQVAEWEDWTAEASSNESEIAPFLQSALPVISKATEMVEAAMATQPPAVLCHRDIRAPNILAGSRYWLIDWDFAGPDVAWWEAITAAMYLAGVEHRGADVELPVFDRFLTSYIRTGGPVGPLSESAFGGLLRGLLGGLAYSSFLALGHRNATPERRVLAQQEVADVTAVLTSVVAGLPQMTSHLQRQQETAPASAYNSPHV